MKRYVSSFYPHRRIHRITWFWNGFGIHLVSTIHSLVCEIRFIKQRSIRHNSRQSTEYFTVCPTSRLIRPKKLFFCSVDKNWYKCNWISSRVIFIHNRVYWGSREKNSNEMSKLKQDAHRIRLEYSIFEFILSDLFEDKMIATFKAISLCLIRSLKLSIATDKDLSSKLVYIFFQYGRFLVEASI